MNRPLAVREYIYSHHLARFLSSTKLFTLHAYMSCPKTYRAWRRTTDPYPHTIKLSTEPLPEELGSNEVLVRVHAVGLNYRDVAMLQEGKYPVLFE